MVAQCSAAQSPAHGTAQGASYRTTATAGGAQATCKAMANTCFPLFALGGFASLQKKKQPWLPWKLKYHSKAKGRNIQLSVQKE